MIEVCEDNIYYTTKRCSRKPKKHRFFVFIIVILILCGGFFYYEYVISDNLYNICSSYVYSYSTKAVNRAVLSSIDQVKYGDLVEIEKNQQGDIVLMSTNSFKVNLINKEVAEATQKNLETSIKNGIPVPFMAFSGISILSGYGKEINYKVVAVSGVKCDFFCKFESVGINQTLHSVYVNVVSTVDIDIPFNKRTVSCENAILISEAVLVGEVPEVYLNGKLFG